MSASAAVMMYLSKIDGQTFVGLDGNLVDLKPFGIDETNLRELSDAIQDVVQDMLDEKPMEEYVMSKL